MAKIIMTDGTRHETIYKQVKTLNAMTDETPGVWSPDVVDAKNAAKSNRLVPSVFSGVNTRMQAMADLPFTIYSVKGDKELDNSDNYKNVVGFLPYPSMTFALTEGALVTAGRAYWYKGRGAQTGQVKELKYWMPSSVQLDKEKAKKGEINFRRQGVQTLFPAKDVLYTWGLDSDVELGPPTIWPLESAIIAAEANGQITKWVADYMRRGAVKAMLLMVDGMPPAGEVDRIEGWFNRFMGGVRGLTWRVFNGAAIKPTIVGDGLEALRDMTVSKELRYEIHTALGTRHLLEDENYATADARERQFVTQTVVPDARLIQYNWNEQVLHPIDYHLEFEPQRLELFQKDEAEQSKTFGELFNIFREVLPVDIAFQLTSEKLDYQFTEEQQAMIARGLAEKKAKAEEVAKQEEVKPEPEAEPVPPEVVKALTELDKFEKKVNAAGKMVTWHAVSLSADMVKAISSGELSFEDARAQIAEPRVKDDSAIKALADSINRAVETATTYNVTMTGGV
jgi:phage portal protein BeeE